MVKNSSELEKEKIKHLCETDLKFLCTVILGMKPWSDDVHGGLARILANNVDQKLILMPRGHWKSSVATVAWSIQQILKNPNIRILITNAIWDRARDFLGQIVGYLTSKSILSGLYSSFDGAGSRFTVDKITISQRTDGTLKDPTVTTAGIGTALTGSHYDIIIHDDLVEENNVATPEQIKKVIRFYENSLDLLDPGGLMVTIGTRWAIGDLYGHIIDTQMTELNGVIVQPNERIQWRELLHKTLTK
jgi:hypothetical protein